MYFRGDFEIISAENIADGFYDFTLRSDRELNAECGQFAHILCGDKTLRRPISICDFDNEKGTLRIVFEVRGEGTEWMSERKCGDILDVIAPIGHGFTIGDTDRHAVFVGGGIGTPPLLAGCKRYGENATAILGFRNSGAVILKDDFERAAGKVMVTTDDGSFGRHGLVTEPLEEVLKREVCDIIYACGPRPMLKAIAQKAFEYGVECEVSLEERMGCGIGACLVCACRINRGGEEKNLHVCKDGPVFNAKEVVW